MNLRGFTTTEKHGITQLVTTRRGCFEVPSRSVSRFRPNLPKSGWEVKRVSPLPDF